MNRDRTGIVIPPPLLFAVPFLGGWLIGRAWEWPLLQDRTTAIAIGLALVIGGVVLAADGIRQFRKARTTVLPFGGTLRIVASGVYRWTRNPMYLGMAVAYAGFSVVVNSGWCLVLLPVAVILVQLLAIGPEERYLAYKFGDSYERYRANVRRWI
jgi:protein-S-isoprenylcysteine O-methyltransferase Ste14